MDNLKIINFISSYDYTSRELLLSLPLDYDNNKKYPLIISPHPFGWSNFENYAHGTPDLVYPFKGWMGISCKYNVIISLPLGHGRCFEKISLAWEAQMQDISEIPLILDRINIKIKMGKIYICGLSMGGMESLVAMALFPELFKAGFTFNALVDLAEWYNDIINGYGSEKLLTTNTDGIIIEEIGGPPDDFLEEYRKRSPISYVKKLSKTNLILYWSNKDNIVPHQEKYHNKKLFELLKKENPFLKVYEYDHSYDHGFNKFDQNERTKCHEFCDLELATRWFLRNF